MMTKVIMAVDAIHRPLTGIGRYAYEMCSGLRASPQISELKYFAHGNWVNDPLSGFAANTNESRKAVSQHRSFRQRLALSPIAVKMYAQVVPKISGWRLRPYGDWVFYSPNFILPPVTGKAVATFHDLSVYDHPEFHPASRVAFMRHEIPKTLTRADILIADSEFTRQRIIEHLNWPEDRVFTVPLGVHHKEFRCINSQRVSAVLDQLGLAKGHYGLCVSTIEPRKNIDRLLLAYSQLPISLRQSCPLVLVGDRGWRSERTHERIKQACAEGWMRYLGYLPETDLRALMVGCGVFIFPSLYEGFGLPVLEAMASGVPILASDLPPIREFAGDSVRYMDPLDVDAMAVALEPAVNDHQWRSNAGEEAERHAEERSWSKVVSTTLKLFEDL